MNKGWIAVDFDGTLATYNGWKGPDHCGDPIQPMVDRVKQWLNEGYEVRIFTARVSPLVGCFRPYGQEGFPIPKNQSERNSIDAIKSIWNWTIYNIGLALPVTNVKDYAMHQVWDDRAIQVIPNTGEVLSDATNITEPDWNGSETPRSSPWKNRLLPIGERLAIADKTIADLMKGK